WCHEEMIPSFSWKSIVTMPKLKQACDRCELRIERFDGQRCQKCSRQSKAPVCQDCQWWQDYFIEKDPLQFNHSVFTYNDFMQEIITKWKYRGDYVLANMFQEEVVQCFKSTFSSLDDAIAVPIPLSE